MKIHAMMLAGMLSAVSTVGAQPAKGGAAFEITEASVTDVQAALTAGRMSSVQLVKLYLARIAAYDHAGPELNSLIRINPKAGAQAAVLDAERRAGKVRGPRCSNVSIRMLSISFLRRLS